MTPTGNVAGRFEATDAKDRQLLADAEAAGARFIVTEDVDDYGLDDLASVGISAVNPDLFLAERLTRAAYTFVIQRFVELQVSPPTTPAQFHAAIAKNHPRLFATHGALPDNVAAGVAAMNAGESSSRVMPSREPRFGS